MSDALDQESASRFAIQDLPADFFSNWYVSSGRQFPWRDPDVSPFGLLVAEILLKQTRAEHVATVWPSLMRLYPNAEELAMADPQQIFQLIEGLGFGNQRTIALLELAAAVAEAGELPAEPCELSKLPYVGMYTSHAVACFGFQRQVPAVDTNVVRVISRITGIEPPSDIRRAPAIWELAWSLLPDGLVKEHNYGLLDFAAAVCRSRSPLCSQCPLNCKCAYRKQRPPDEVQG